MAADYYNNLSGIITVNKSLAVPRSTFLSYRQDENFIKMLAMACSAILIISTLLIMYLGIIHY